MRITRVKKFKKSRHKKVKKIFIYAVVFPSLSIVIGYFITALFILPVIAK